MGKVQSVNRFYFMVRLYSDPCKPFSRVIEASTFHEADERIRKEFKGRYASIEFSYEEVVDV